MAFDVDPIRFICVTCLYACICMVDIDEITGLSCSQCESAPGESCMTSPPLSVPCKSRDGDKANMNCMTTKHLTDNGTLVFFSRGCTVASVGDGCIQMKENATICYAICHYDGCNEGYRLSPRKQRDVVLFTIIFIVVSFFV